MIAFTLALRNVLRRRERSLLTLIGVLLAVGTFVAMVSLAEGLYRRVSLELDGRSVDVYVMPVTAAPLPTGPVGTIGLTTDTVGLDSIKRIAGLPNVRRVAGITRAQWSGKRGVVMVLGIDPTEIPHFLPALKVVDGRLMEAGQIMLGIGLAELERKAVGDKVRHSQTEYPISGLAAAGSGFQDYFAYMPVATALQESNAKGVQEVWVQLDDPHRAVEVVKAIQGLKIAGARVMTRRQYLGSANDYIQYAWLLQFAISAIGVLIAVTAAMNTMLMSTYERMREFGTLRAIGTPRGTVVGMVIAESVMLSVFGGLLGIVFGWIGSILLDRAMVVLLQVSFPLAAITPALIVEALLLSFLVGLIGAAIPSVLVWRLNIVEGLRWE